jgi:cyclic pyranopterin phosphate synthase
MPSGGIEHLMHQDILTYEEIRTVVRSAAELGINKVRLSGGEPLIRLGLAKLIEMLASIEGIDDISLTTNGILLEDYAAELKEVGLGRVNISLDSLKAQRFQSITGEDKLDNVLRGIEAAGSVGLIPIKINVVVIRGVNDDEVIDFALRSKEGWNVRFIEFMNFMDKDGRPFEFVSAEEIRNTLSSLGELQSCEAPQGNGPAKYYRLPGADGTIGFITPVSDHFCFRCNRLRLTADGRLLPCLMSEESIDLRDSLRKGAAIEELKRLIIEAITRKPEGHRLAEGCVPNRGRMSQIGG